MADKNGRSRTRNYACIVYPESAPADWVDILSGFHVGALVSPLHDKDLNKDKSLKKPHYHVILIFDSVKSIDQAKEIFDAIGGVGCEAVKCLQGYARYLCHLDEADKAHYPMEEILQVCGVNYVEIIELSSDRLEVLMDIISYCKEEGIVEFNRLIDYCLQENHGWFRVISESGVYILKEYMKSMQWDKGQLIR